MELGAHIGSVHSEKTGYAMWILPPGKTTLDSTPSDSYFIPMDAPIEDRLRQNRDRDTRTSPMDIIARNFQAEPQKCTKINPRTNMPCNRTFTRTYDLTRHEDTIHNDRKPKVKCPFCPFEKTFSRNDALTRHIRLVHPEKLPGSEVDSLLDEDEGRPKGGT